MSLEKRDITCSLVIAGHCKLVKVFIVGDKRAGSVVVLAHVRVTALGVRHILPLS